MKMKKSTENDNNTMPQSSPDSGGQSDLLDGFNTPTTPRNGNTSIEQRTQASSLFNGAANNTKAQSPDQSQSNSTRAANPNKSIASTINKSEGNAVPIINVRGRKDRPCDACRRRKSRCVLNEGTTVCVLCRFHGQDCTFVQLPLPRRKKVPVDNNPAADNKRDHRDRDKDDMGGGIKREKDRMPYSKKRSNEPDSPNSRASFRQRPSAPSSPPPPAPTSSRHRDEDLDPSNSLGLHPERHSQYLGKTAEYEMFIIDLYKLDSSLEFTLTHHHPNASIKRVNPDESFLMLPDQDTGQTGAEFDQELHDVDAVEAIVAPYGEALVHLYFRVVHPSFPILHKKLFLEKYKRTHREFAPCLLSAVYLIALNWMKYDPELSEVPTPDIDKLEKIATRCMSDVISHPKLSTIQAGLLMLQRLGPAASSKSWALNAQLVAVGQELGLHLDCMEWRIPNWEKGLRKRLAWALYMQDKWGALTHGRPSHITSVNWAVRQIALEDFPEIPRDGGNEGEVVELENGKVLFMEMIKLTQITGEILDGFFTVDASRVLEGKISRVLERAKPLQIKLKDWHARLPDVLRMDSTSRVKKLSSNGYLHLAYFATEITLHRQILRTLSPPLTTPHPMPGPDPYLLHICRSAAKTRLISAMDFVNRLKPEHLQSFWYFASKVNFALIGTFGSLLWATSPTVQEAEFYKARLAEYRWTLRVSAKGAEFMEFAVGVLDVGIGRVQQDEWNRRHDVKRDAASGENGSCAEAASLGMIGIVGMGAGTGGSHDVGMSGTGSMSTGSGITSPATLPPPPPHMSPPATGDEMDQDEDEDDDDEDDEDGRAFEHNGGYRVGHSSDHDIDMGFMGESSKYGGYDRGARDGGDVDGDSSGSGSPYPHPPQVLPPGYNPPTHPYQQQHYHQYGHSWQDGGQAQGSNNQ